MELLCIQSQEHPFLPIAELKAVIECEEMECNLEVIIKGLVIIKDIKAEKINEYYKILIKRLGYTHEIHQIIKKSTTNDLNEDVEDIDWSYYIKDTFAVRVKRFFSKIDTVATERKVGSVILNNTRNIKVNLDKPTSLIRLVAFEDTVYISIEKYKLDKKHFEDIKPHKRPFFYPGSMSPKLARCMVNLSRVKKGDLLLDPFCGTGGILIEAGLIGCKVVGSDIYWKMKNGTAINLEFCGIKDYKTFNLDVRELKMYEKVASVVTDPPYGISTSTGNIDGDDIFKEFFNAIYDNMKDDAYLCIASPHYVDLKPMMDEVGFKLVEEYEIKMHRSLTRIISVIRKNI
ncbi:23S rRNA m(2) methyltransferase [Methanobrevibacter oralis]|uniref:tRNA (guanine(10)-N(2))-dimethyltransferase n=1 Tax=Methanobrevibacter oralis TaxID=66851 RepID=A0A162FPD0_METOA|nr:TIGR01177 family methyltransferase [Methanobrevibacter oralis]KZX13100.1 23S rRNA m(2) methyltransferase [Methanobrevibacter oralis]